MNKINKREFLREFKELLEKYDLAIGTNLCENEDAPVQCDETMNIYYSVSGKANKFLEVSLWNIHQ